MGANSGVRVELGPGKSVTAKLTASKVIMEIEVEYRATIDGQVACNYSNEHEGHHFYGLHVGDVLGAAGKQTVETFKEILKLIFYTDDRVIVKDAL